MRSKCLTRIIEIRGIRVAEKFNLTEEELRRYVDAAGEEPHIDHKGPVEWDKSKQSASLAKDIMACANTRQGGALVIGVKEENGQLERVGVTDKQAASFDTTKVAAWVNKYCEPPIQFTCYVIDHHQKKFVIIRVAEFDDVPVICTKAFHDPDNTKKRLLTEGELYVRKPGAESAPIRTANDLRPLIGLASTKKQDELLRAIRSVMEGTPPRPVVEPEELYAEEREELQAAVTSSVKRTGRKGAWLAVSFPILYESERVASPEGLIELAEKGLASRGWTRLANYASGLNHGILIGLDEMAIALAHSGLCVIQEPYLEDARAFRDPWHPPEAPLQAGHWVEYRHTIWRVVRIFRFLAGCSEALDPSEELVYDISADQLESRFLVSETGRVPITRLDHPSLARKFTRRNQVTAAEFRAGWQEHCADILLAFFRLFYPSIKREVIMSWIAKAQ